MQGAGGPVPPKKSQLLLKLFTSSMFTSSFDRLYYLNVLRSLSKKTIR